MQRFRPYHIQVEYARKNPFSRTRLISSEEQFIEKIIPLPEELGRGAISAIQLQAGLGFAHFEIHSAKNTFKIRVTIREECFKFLAPLSYDHMVAKASEIEKKIILDSSSSYVLSSCSCSFVIRVNHSTYINLVCVFIPPSILENLIKEREIHFSKEFYSGFEKASQKPFLHKMVISPAIHLIGNQLQNCPMQGSLKRLYIEAKLLELLAIQLSQLCYNQDSAGERKEHCNSTIVRMKIHEAMEILSYRIQDPPTIYSLAQMVGLNTTSLKRGFKEETGSTVFGYVNKLRTQQAIIFLRNTDMNVSEIAWEIGYNTISGFSAAFKREMGFHPSVLRKERG